MLRPRMTIRRYLRRAYPLMRARFGHQHWWPADSPFEVCVGAILVQNTSWSNVERTLTQLKDRALLDPARLAALSESSLAQLLRPSGYFNVKARRLRAFLLALMRHTGGDLRPFLSGPTTEVRQRLLSIPGIGPETADSILLYAAEHLRFVIDAYTRRIFVRHQWAAPDASYHDLQTLCETVLTDPPHAARILDYWRDYHAQLVRIGKYYCRPSQPQCDDCPLRPLLPKPLPVSVRTRPLRPVACTGPKPAAHPKDTPASQNHPSPSSA